MRPASTLSQKKVEQNNVDFCKFNKFLLCVESTSYHCLEWAVDRTPDASNGRQFRHFLELLPVFIEHKLKSKHRRMTVKVSNMIVTYRAVNHNWERIGKPLEIAISNLSISQCL